MSKLQLPCKEKTRDGMAWQLSRRGIAIARQAYGVAVGSCYHAMNVSARRMGICRQQKARCSDPVCLALTFGFSGR